MSNLLAAIGGFLLVPVAGSLATRAICDAAKPKSVTSVVFIGAAAHAAAALASSAAEDHFRDPALKSFLHGGVWGEGVAAGLLGAAGLYSLTPSGKLALANTPLAPVLPPGAVSSTAMAAPPMVSAPKGLLGLLTAAKAAGYP